MTPIPPEVRDLIDPALTINGDGLGGLVETERGLRCPVRGCGDYYRQLTRHLNRSHSDIGGAARVKELMSIPQSVPLICLETRDKYVAAGEDKVRRGVVLGDMRHTRTALRKNGPSKKAGRTRSVSVRSINHLNLRDSCPAQLQERIVRLHHKLRRTPSLVEFSTEYGRGMAGAVTRVYGSWANALGQCGLESAFGKYELNDALDALRAWYDVHKSLPTYAEANRADRIPLIPLGRTFLKLFDTQFWDEAMRRAGSLLGVALTSEPARQRPHRMSREYVLESLSAYHAVHGDLPRVTATTDENAYPSLPCRQTIYKALGVNSWREAMCCAAQALAIRSDRYGQAQAQEA